MDIHPAAHRHCPHCEAPYVAIRADGYVSGPLLVPTLECICGAFVHVADGTRYELDGPVHCGSCHRAIEPEEPAAIVPAPRLITAPRPMLERPKRKAWGDVPL